LRRLSSASSRESNVVTDEKEANHVDDA